MLAERIIPNHVTLNEGGGSVVKGFVKRGVNACSATSIIHEMVPFRL